MDVFDVHRKLIDDYRAFTTAFVDILDPRVREHVRQQLDRGEQWPEPWLSLAAVGQEIASLAPAPFDPATRAHWRAELDAAFFHLYGIERADVDYIMETFPIVRRKDMAAHGEFRTKRMILECYDAIAEAIRTGVPYERP